MIVTGEENTAELRLNSYGGPIYCGGCGESETLHQPLSLLNPDQGISGSPAAS